MKKTFTLLMAAAMMLAIATSCNKATSGKINKDDMSDSITMEFAKLQGSGLNFSIQKDSVNKIDKEALIKGLELSLGINDTTDEGKSKMQGFQMGMQLKQMIATAGDDLQGFDMELFVKEFKKALRDEKTKLDEDGLKKMQEQFMKLLERAADKRAEKDAEAVANKKQGDAFLKNKVAKEGFKTTKSGIAYKMEAEGSGDTFKDTDKIDVVYVGKHINDSVFDQSTDKPAALSPTGVVPGFAEMLKMMRPGAKATVIIPAKLGYGPKGQMPKIKKNETLVFEIETKGIHQMTPEEQKQQDAMQKMLQQQQGGKAAAPAPKAAKK